MNCCDDCYCRVKRFPTWAVIFETYKKVREMSANMDLAKDVKKKSPQLSWGLFIMLR
jgi:predicted protein tyrosine phosphatase